MKQFYFLVLWCISFLGYSQYPNIKDITVYLDILSEHDRFMGVVLIQQGTTVLFEDAYGYRSIEKKLKNMTETSFRLGAISKTVTATMIFQLIEEEKLNLDTTLSTYFPQVSNAHQITIDHLLRHQSGIYDVVSSYADSSTEFSNTESTLWKYITSKPSTFQQGTRTSYNHTNYWLLAKIIENLDKQSYAESIAKRINTASSFQLTDDHPADILKNEAHSYLSNGVSWKLAKETSSDLTKGSGSLVGSAHDILTFYRILLTTDELLKKKSRRQLLKTNREGYGAGIFKLPYKNIKGYGHTGTIDGFKTRVAYFSESDITLAILSNGLNYDMDAITAAVVRSIQGEDIELPLFASIILDEEQLKAFPGTFSSEQAPIPLTIHSKGGNLTLQAGNELPIILEAESEAIFSFVALDIEIQFEDLNNSQYQRLIFIQNGQRFVFNRD